MGRDRLPCNFFFALVPHSPGSGELGGSVIGAAAIFFAQGFRVQSRHPPRSPLEEPKCATSFFCGFQITNYRFLATSRPKFFVSFWISQVFCFHSQLANSFVFFLSVKKIRE